MAKKSALEHPQIRSESSSQSESEPGKQYAKAVELGLGTHMLGTVLSLQAKRGTQLEITALGVIAVSGKNSRRVLVPWANVKACELMPPEAAKQSPKAASSTQTPPLAA